jgi:hypothetical protein
VIGAKGRSFLSNRLPGSPLKALLVFKEESFMISKTGSILTAVFLFSSFGCNSGASAEGPTGINGISTSKTAASGTGPNPSVGSSCQNGDPNRICLAVKYVVYKDDSGQPIMSANDVVKNIEGINKLWSQCNLGFQVEQLVNPLPKDYGLEFHTADDSDLTDIRKAFVDESTLLVVTTGSWNRNGSLGNTGANAWTSMPGENPLGTVLESSVKTFSNIIAHELGHYLDLNHQDNGTNLMNPVIYDNSVNLNDAQCAKARNTAETYWQKMKR